MLQAKHSRCRKRQNPAPKTVTPKNSQLSSLASAHHLTPLCVGFRKWVVGGGGGCFLFLECKVALPELEKHGTPLSLNDLWIPHACLSQELGEGERGRNIFSEAGARKGMDINIIVKGPRKERLVENVRPEEPSEKTGKRRTGRRI